MIESQRSYRHELKYALDQQEAVLLRERLKDVIHQDRYARDGGYKIRSLYFDDFWNSAAHEKMAGVSERRKYRIRIYNDSDQQIKLECKQKRESYISKSVADLTRWEADAVLEGDYNFLLKREENVCREFYFQCMSRYLRPKVIVDYEREPYMMDAGEVRITFDRNIRAAILSKDIFDPHLPVLPAIEPEKLILEVKFTQFFPKLLQKLLPVRSSDQQALSKFLMCCESIDYMSTGIIIN